jgi:hypothetical protein
MDRILRLMWRWSWTVSRRMMMVRMIYWIVWVITMIVAITPIWIVVIWVATHVPVPVVPRVVRISPA